MKELTKHEKAIRDKDTKDLTLPELKEKIRIINKEVHNFDVDIFKLAGEISSVHVRRLKRIAYAGTLKADYNRRVIPPFNKEL